MGNDPQPDRPWWAAPQPPLDQRVAALREYLAGEADVVERVAAREADPGRQGPVTDWWRRAATWWARWDWTFGVESLPPPLPPVPDAVAALEAARVLLRALPLPAGQAGPNEEPPPNHPDLFVADAWDLREAGHAVYGGRRFVVAGVVRRLLARLVRAGGRVVLLEQLVEDLDGIEPSTLTGYAARLRAVLRRELAGLDGLPADPVPLIDRQGYRLNLP